MSTLTNAKLTVPTIDGGAASNLSLQAYSTTVITVDGANARVGIGTASPATLLHIESSSPIMTIKDGTNSGFDQLGRIDFTDSADTTRFTLGLVDDSSGDAELKLANAANLLFKTNAQTRMTIDSSGDVGIGTSSINGKAHIKGTRVDAPNSGLPSGAMLRLSDDSTLALDIGEYSSSLAFWMQVSDVSSLNSHYPLAINPNGGNVGIGTTSPTAILEVKDSDTTGFDSFTTFLVGNSSGSVATAFGNGGSGGFAAGESTTDCLLRIRKDSTTSRSINAAGTLNASGTDYAEYMIKKSVNITFEKGDICGINSDGKLTDKFSESIAFAVKSTNPSYVGGDNWFTKDKEEFESIEDFEQAREQARQLVDRVAFTGQVPCNIDSEFTVGDYIIPVQGDNDSISAITVSTADMTFEQFKRSVGQIWKRLEDGRPYIGLGMK